MFKQYPWLAIAVRNGVVAGVLGGAMLAGLFFMGRHPIVIPPYLDFRLLLFAVMLFITLREFRDYFQQGILFFWQGMFMSLVFTAVFALIASLIVYGLARLRPEFVGQYISLQLERFKAATPEDIRQIGPDQFEKVIKSLPSTTGLDLAYLYFWQSFGISFFVSIIISVILRRQPKT